MSPDTPPSSAQAQSRAELIRAVERLRVGLPPSGAAVRVSIGTETLAAAFERFLGTRAHPGLILTGNYGAGKSHSLMLLRSLALAEGHATCWLTADGFQCALNHPQRFLSTLLGTLETPGGDSGYSAMLARLLATPTLRDTVIETVAYHMNGSTNLDYAVRQVLFDLTAASRKRDGKEEMHLRSDDLARLLSGETLTGLGGLPNYRSMAYRLLGLAANLAELAGNRGLLILVDEVESVFTKFKSFRSRAGAYRMLSAVCMGMGESPVRVAMALTPDASASMERELDLAIDVHPPPSFEPLGQFRDAILTRKIPSLRCHSPSIDELELLLERIKSAYCDTYPATSQVIGRNWVETVNSILHRRPPVRIAVRDCIDFLDRARLASENGISGGVPPVSETA